MFRYGQRVVDSITGFSGKVVAKMDFFGRGPEEYLVQRNGQTGIVEHWFAENRLEIEEKKSCCHIPSAELVEEVPLGRTKEELESQLGAMLKCEGLKNS